MPSSQDPPASPGNPCPGGIRTRYAVVGTGARAEMFVRALATRYADRAQLVAFADLSEARMAAHNRLLGRCGAQPVPTYHASRFAEMLDAEQVDTVLVTTVDRTHAEYLVAALLAGRDAITEKPMAIDASGCRSILEAVAHTGRNVTVTFNYRYNPVHETVKRLLDAGEIGQIASVHFEWLLDVRHGADYFRRWHRDKANSGGLMVHKASHHFDLVNWWLSARPVRVYATGRLFFYGQNGARHGYDRGYQRAHGSPAAVGDPFALHLAEHNRLRELYLDAEAEAVRSGTRPYLRDRNVFAPGVSIEDDMAVLAEYDTGATMTYHLTAYAPWEGYRLMVNGSRGRLELEMVESDRVDPHTAGTVKGEASAAARRLDAAGQTAALHGATAAAEQGGMRLCVRRFWEAPQDIEVPGYTREGHGGADLRMTEALFGGVPDPLARQASAADGALALLTGLAANESFRTASPVKVDDLLPLALR